MKQHGLWIRWFPGAGVRWLPGVLIFLLLGAILNVAVAWGCSGFTEYWWEVSVKLQKAGIYEITDIELPDGAGKAICEQFFSAAKKYPSDDFIGSIFSSVPGYTTIHGYKWNGGGEDEMSVYIHCAGLPLRSLKYIETEYLSSNTDGYEWTTHGVLPNRHQVPFTYGYPLLPIWSGFIFNTLFYATPLWLLFPGRYMLRRHRRIRRGRCGGCGYIVGPNVGVPGASPNCPECGMPIAKIISSKT